MAIIELSHVTLKRGGNVILDDVSWVVPAKQHCVILGMNGSGKTALLQVITGYLPPTAGDITVLGKRYGTYDLRELRKSIGWVSSALHQRIHSRDTALEVVASGKFASIGLWEEPTSQDVDQAGAQLRFMGCEDLASRRYDVLSQGEKQRVLIARSLMLNPQLVILDEPCSGLDPASREFFLQFIQKLGQQPEGPTLIYVTHHIEEIVPTFSHVHVMKAGRPLVYGHKDTVITDETLKQAFDMDMKVTRTHGRYWIRECML